MRRRFATAPRRLLAAALLLGAVWMAGCAEQTAGTPLSLDTQVVGGVSSGDGSFTNERGWTVELEEARLLLGPVFFYSAQPRAGLLERLIGPRRVYACAAEAQFDKGTILGELRRQVLVDLLDPQATSLGATRGETGFCRMFELHIHPPGKLTDGPPAAALAAHGDESVVISGKASRNGVDVHFTGAMTLPETGTLRVVGNIAAEVEFEPRPGFLQLTVHPERWLQNADFGSLLDAENNCLVHEDDGICRIDEDSQVYAAWMTGIRSRYSYDLEWRED